MFGSFELLLILGAIVLIFGGSKLPGAITGTKQAVKNFKLALKEDTQIKVKKLD